ncbi:MAG: 23S rRNA (adenine(2503)-C(2))-methyltransferase RlmN [Candidatus Sumerlaeia bacterium]|nr:23S rRNA (adenine(2503)-C(2))-methyltransferase RlmN [Candidatus Sumerlaeia bacterium]
MAKTIKEAQTIRDPRPVLLRQSLTALQAELQRHGFQGYRAKQIFHWLYKQAVPSVAAMTNLPAELRDWLDTFYRFGGVQIAERRDSADGSIKLILALADGARIESVLMHDEDRRTLCISSQVGCPLGCLFCMTGQGGFVRNCTADEIVGQYLAARQLLGPGAPPITHIVFMGMGEPLLNCDAVFEAIRRLTDPQAVGLSPRRITVSTAGVAAGIRKLGEAKLNVKLAVSLNASTEDQRGRLMPYARRDRLESVLEACRQFPMPRQHRITFEYVLFDGVNDSPVDARRLGQMLRGIRCKINLIPFNPVEGVLPFRRPPQERIEAFQQILIGMNYTASIRYSKGADVGAACGQLAAHAGAQLLYDTRAKG